MIYDQIYYSVYFINALFILLVENCFQKFEKSNKKPNPQRKSERNWKRKSLRWNWWWIRLWSLQPRRNRAVAMEAQFDSWESERERVPKTNLHFLVGLSIIVNFVMSLRWIWPVVDEGWWWRLGIRVLLVWVEERDKIWEKWDIYTLLLTVRS